MPEFLPQPRLKFGDILAKEIDSGSWKLVDIAVAWAQAAGVRLIEPALRRFLRNGGKTRLFVGVDFEHTSREALDLLLDLAGEGSLQVMVFNDENDAATFHPKCYVFRNAAEARILVGSNNLTWGGLSSNWEASARMDVPVSDKFFGQVMRTLDEFEAAKGVDGKALAVRLDLAFLEKLSEEGYVPAEESVRSRQSAKSTTRTARNRPRLFGRTTPNYPPKKARPAAPVAVPLLPSPTQLTASLVIRVRKARGQQVQFPFELVDTGYLTDGQPILSLHDKKVHAMHLAKTKNKAGTPKRNTMKMEMPETRLLADAIALIRKVGKTTVYEVHESESHRGRELWRLLEDGLGTDPPSTHVTVKQAPETATIWRILP